MKRLFENSKKIAAIAAALCVALGTGAAGIVSADVQYMPNVTSEMSRPSFWLELGDTSGREILATPEEIAAINQSIYDTRACMMTDLKTVKRYYNQKSMYRSLWASAFSDAVSVMYSAHYDLDGNEWKGSDLNKVMANIGGDEAEEIARIQYGICVHRTDIVALPADILATDEKEDLDYNFYQMSALRVNEPVIVKGVSKDKKYYYVLADCVSGWAKAADIAICEDRDEWLEAWDIPDEEAIVVTESRIYLEESNFNPVVNGISIPMGSVLRKVSEEEYDDSIMGRMSLQNYAIWLPIRQEDGSYAKTIALISQNHSVSEGYLPLTTENILNVAFEKLGEVYGWGSMLNSVDCSNYIRDIYKCFGLSLARNTTWQSEMPVFKYDVSEATDDEKRAILDSVPAGTVLYFNGHEMMYLGCVDGKYYVISALGSIKAFDSNQTVRVRSVVINDIDIVRPNGNTWLKSINMILIPYLPPYQEEVPEEAPAEGVTEIDASPEQATAEAATAEEVSIEEAAAEQAAAEEAATEEAAAEEATTEKAAAEEATTEEAAAEEATTEEAAAEEATTEEATAEEATTEETTAEEATTEEAAAEEATIEEATAEQAAGESTTKEASTEGTVTAAEAAAEENAAAKAE